MDMQYQNKCITIPINPASTSFIEQYRSQGEFGMDILASKIRLNNYGEPYIMGLNTYITRFNKPAKKLR